MPEKPEVITVANKLKLKLIGKTFNKVRVLYKNIIEGIDIEEFETKLIGQTINDITTRGKWIIFTLDDYLLLAHLRMEGKFFYRKEMDPINKHEHVLLTFTDRLQLRFADVRKFAKMMLLDKSDYLNKKPFNELGKEPWDKDLTKEYLKDKYIKKSIPIKTTLLDQSIITGIGNIYADEILFMSNINPLKKTNNLTLKEMDNIINNTKQVLDKAIKEGGTTIRNYTSEEGVTGLFQNSLLVHMKENQECTICKTKIKRIKIGGRSTYFCPKCQNKE